MNDASGESDALSRFQRFVAAILTVTKEDVRKIEEQVTDIVRPQEPALDDEVLDLAR